MSENKKLYTVTKFQAAGLCNGQGEMPLASFVDELIQIATLHANSNDFGYARLIKQNCTWVLSRVIADIVTLPAINSTYILETWVENVGRLMTQRNFEMRDAATGAVMARAMTVWCAINRATRRPADLLSSFPGLTDVIDPRPVNVAAGSKPRPVRETTDPVDSYRFRVSDIDLNRHVNSCRYVELIVDHWSLDFYDRHRITGLDLSFHREALYGQLSHLKVAAGDLSASVELCDDTDNPYCLARLTFAPR